MRIRGLTLPIGLGPTWVSTSERERERDLETDMTHSRFVHERLDAYHIAHELSVGVHRLTASFPRGHADLRAQLRRSSASVIRHIAEAANRISPKDRAARFAVARGACGECDASLHLAETLKLATTREIDRLRTLTDRVAAMLTGLIRRERQRVSASGRSISSATERRRSYNA
jgi:four helix bundle protein